MNPIDTSLPFDPAVEAAPLEAPAVVSLRDALSDVMRVGQTSVPVAPDEVIQFKGRLSTPSAQAYPIRAPTP